MSVRVGEEIQEVLRQGLVSGSDTALPWYADGLEFTCTQCGNCCSGAPGYVWVSVEECHAIAASLGLGFEAFTRKHVRRAGKRLSLLERKNGDCEFLVREAAGLTRCAIHAVRPVQCRTWPFWRSNLDSPQTWALAGMRCSGINRGELLSPKEIDERANITRE